MPPIHSDAPSQTGAGPEGWGHVLSRCGAGSSQSNQLECWDRIALLFFLFSFYFLMPQTPVPMPHPKLKGFNILLEMNHNKRKFLQWHISLSLSQGWHLCFYQKRYIIHVDQPSALTVSVWWQRDRSLICQASWKTLYSPKDSLVTGIVLARANSISLLSKSGFFTNYFLASRDSNIKKIGTQINCKP